MASDSPVPPSLRAPLAETEVTDPDARGDELDPLRSHTEDDCERIGQAILRASPTPDLINTETILEWVKVPAIHNCVTSLSQPRFPAQLQPPSSDAETGSFSSTSHRELHPMGPMRWPEKWGSCPLSKTEMPPESCLMLPSVGDIRDAAVNPSKYGLTSIFGLGVCYKLFWNNEKCDKGRDCAARHEPLHPYEIRYFALIGQHDFLNNYADLYMNHSRDQEVPPPTEPLPFTPTTGSEYERPHDLPPFAFTVHGQGEVKPMLWRRFKYFYRTFRTRWQLEDEMYDYADTEWSSK